MRGLLLAGVLFCAPGFAAVQAASNAPEAMAASALADARRIVDAAAQPAAAWTGPHTGPRAE
ncbi:MAG: sugar ABC transporter substrate-binding protein, partial [Burkholderiales bacterium]|nr:sugar ABC transporter substrate-binding protein [Burkholderiales bacterium]